MLGRRCLIRTVLLLIDLIMVSFIQRPTRYFYLKIIRQEGSPDQISAGMALGVFIGLITPPGPQMVLAVIIATFAGANRISSAIGVWITNPLTIPFIYPVQVWLGSLVSGIPLNFTAPTTIPELWELFTDSQNQWNLIVTLMIGAFVSAIVTSFVSYFATKFVVNSYRQKKLARQERIRKRQEAAQTQKSAAQ
ncbi:MAG: DUF2062 domain-containing protein [Candidatus Hinthialibacter antarcticus]|nr:DUF2062 domain-containing protein [Candidatus Hinthialibacter antarcticus]